eukprot:12419147-Karenia_brevis.AAC.1
MQVDGIVIAAKSLFWTGAFGVKSRWAGIYAAEIIATIAITDGSQALSMTAQELMSMSRYTRCWIERNLH